MEIVNVVVIDDGYCGVTSFPILKNTKANRDAQARKAEKLFTKLLKSLDVTNKEDIEAYLEEGTYEDKDRNITMYITWSDKVVK